jgi:hypothetical protein
MIRRFILKLLLRLYIKENREIVKLTIGEEFNYFKFGNRDDIIKLLKSFMTAQTLWYWECKDDKERYMIKGATIVLKILIDGHSACMNIEENENDKIKQYKLWERFKTNINFLDKTR